MGRPQPDISTSTENGCSLVVPPYLGEFGWELMNWQGRVRKVVSESSFRTIFLCGTPDRRMLYDDLLQNPNVRFCPMSAFAWPGEASDDHRIDEDGVAIPSHVLEAEVRAKAGARLRQLGIDPQAADWLLPGYRSRLWKTGVAEQQFVSLRGAPQAVAIDVILIPRLRALAPDRNLPLTWWETLADALFERGLRVEFYKSSLVDAVVQLSRARLAAGASTGGLHLASLCGCPHYVWGSGDEDRWTALKISNRQRYETVWNPLGTPCVYDEIGWQPQVEVVAQRIRETLDRIGLRAQPRIRPSWHAKWRIKRRLLRVLEKPPRENRWPWRVQELVRRHLL